MLYRVPLLFTVQSESGYVVTSPVLPELVTEGDSIEDAWANVPDALAAVVEIYEDLGKTLPHMLNFSQDASCLTAETLVAMS